MRFLNKHAAREKQLRRLERESNRLHHAQWRAPVVPLEHPFQRGWMKTFVLRGDVARRPDASLFRTVLAAINHQVYCRNRDFLSPRGFPIELHPRKIRVARWLKLGWPASHQRLFSYGHWRLDEENTQPIRLRAFILGFKLTTTWWLEEIVQPHLITHQRVDLPEVRERIAEIDATFTACCGRARLGRLHGQRQRWRFDTHCTRDKRAIVTALEELTTT